MCTGNTLGSTDEHVGATVYPCVYREHALYVKINQHFARFIPVCTGNTIIKMPANNHSPVYPCVYREHVFNLLLASKYFGLSLCVQGTQCLQLLGNQKARFIPVCTGNTH